MKVKDLFHWIIKRNSVMIISIMIFLAIGTAVALLKRPVYIINFTINSTISSKDEYNNKTVIISAVKNFEKLHAKNNSRNFMNQREIEIYRDFRNIEIVTSPDKISYDDAFLNLVLYVYDTIYLDSIINDLIFYINNNQYIRQSYDNERMCLNKTLDGCNSAIRKLEKIKEKINNVKNTPLYFNIYYDLAELKGKVAELTDKIARLDGIKIVDSPVIPANPTGITIVNSYILFTILGFFIGLIIIIGLEKRLF